MLRVIAVGSVETVVARGGCCLSWLGRAIAYSDLAKQIKAWPLTADSEVLHKMLDDISHSQDQAGNGMLSAVVIHKNDDDLPGPGFFKLAAGLGRHMPDKETFHIQEIQRVHDAFAR